jgi:hypothetical protein
MYPPGGHEYWPRRLEGKGLAGLQERPLPGRIRRLNSE